ncbi:hypothetical protein [Mycolicibacterium sp.]|uniref:hypothetical protein n=1 Tax=Mycolicibacterium sp. TaxID=2320850 RepID=UPI001D3924BC|nr:hypothetical protein [Mycolicibacterium sp.]MCB1290353.1 hypothetical protein [Mycobacterium sp.]MCB9408320.1 hypothetical protein [Mycolicibacterium sp.]
MTVARPLCVTCHRRHREPGSPRCCDCGAGRIHGTTPPPRRRPRPTPAEQLGDAEETDEAETEAEAP